jgi:hypothetical protein
MAIILPFTVSSADDLPVMPSNFETELFQNSGVTSWYTADASYISTATQSSITRATTIADRTPNGNNLTATFSSSFVWDPSTNFDADIAGATFLRSDNSTKGYVSPISPWTTGDHFKIFLFKATTPAASRYLQGATGTGNHNVQISVLDRVVANVGSAQVIITRDPSMWNLVITSFDATAGSLGVLCNSRGFTSTAGIGAACGTTSPTIGANTGVVTGANCSYRDIATGNVDLRKSANSALFSVILDYFETVYGLDLGV